MVPVMHHNLSTQPIRAQEAPVIPANQRPHKNNPPNLHNKDNPPNLPRNKKPTTPSPARNPHKQGPPIVYQTTITGEQIAEEQIKGHGVCEDVG